MGQFLVASLVGFLAGLVGIWKSKDRAFRDVMINLILSVFLLVSFAYNIDAQYKNLKKEKYTKTWGTFNFSTDINRNPSLFLGRYQLKSATIGKDKWEVWLENGKANLRGVVRDREGDKVFDINDTDWKNYTGKDFNYDERGIEVKDSKGNIVFQLEFNKQENKVSIFGIFYFGPDKLVLVGRDDNRNIMGQSPSSDADINSFINSTRPMFKYPRENHLGERVAN